MYEFYLCQISIVYVFFITNGEYVFFPLCDILLKYRFYHLKLQLPCLCCYLFFPEEKVVLIFDRYEVIKYIFFNLYVNPYVSNFICGNALFMLILHIIFLI